jgi:2'-5' RNA ligase
MAEQLIRCFVAVEVPATVLSVIEHYIQALKKIIPDIHWAKVNGIHITLKFLGEIKPDLVKQVEEILIPLSHIYKPFTVKVKGTGCFPNKSKPRIFWLGLEQDSTDSLSEIHEWIETNLKPLGFSEEERGFSPHLTLGRVKKPQNFAPLFTFMEKTPFSEQVFKVDKIVLMRSELKPAGAEYSVIRSYSWHD